MPASLNGLIVDLYRGETIPLFDNLFSFFNPLKSLIAE